MNQIRKHVHRRDDMKRRARRCIQIINRGRKKNSIRGYVAVLELELRAEVWYKSRDARMK